MVRSLRRSYSRVFCSSCLAILQLAPRPRPLAQSSSDYELYKQHQEELQGEHYLKFPVFGQIFLLLRRGLAKSQGQSIQKSGPICRVSKYTIQEYTQEE